MSGRVLFMFHDGMEDIEAVAPLDILRRAGIDVLTLAVSTNRQVVTRSEVPMLADECLRFPVNTDDFDMLVIPGGPGIKDLRNDHGYLNNMIDCMYQEHRWVAAICAAPLLLKDQGLLINRRYTSHPSTAEELPDRDPAEAVVVDGSVITSQGAGTSILFGLKLVEVLRSKEEADAIAAAMCCQH